MSLTNRATRYVVKCDFYENTIRKACKRLKWPSRLFKVIRNGAFRQIAHSFFLLVFSIVTMSLWMYLTSNDLEQYCCQTAVQSTNSTNLCSDVTSDDFKLFWRHVQHFEIIALVLKWPFTVTQGHRKWHDSTELSTYIYFISDNFILFTFFGNDGG